MPFEQQTKLRAGDRVHCICVGERSDSKRYVAGWLCTCSSSSQQTAAFLAFLLLPAETPVILLAMQEDGADVIELGIPYTDPQADGATIQRTNQVAIKAGHVDHSPMSGHGETGLANKD
jgi:Tryptophan synthase alpha chain